MDRVQLPPPAAATVTSAPATRWTSVKFGGYVPGNVFHPTSPNVLYARTDVGGAYRWDAATNAWISITDNQGRAIGERLMVAPNNSAILFYASRTSGLWKSADRGQTWAQLSSLATTTLTRDQINAAPWASISGVESVLFDTATRGTVQRRACVLDGQWRYLDLHDSPGPILDRPEPRIPPCRRPQESEQGLYVQLGGSLVEPVIRHDPFLVLDGRWPHVHGKHAVPASRLDRDGLRALVGGRQPERGRRHLGRGRPERAAFDELGRDLDQAERHRADLGQPRDLVLA